MAFPIEHETERVLVAGVGLGVSRGRTMDGIWLMDFPNYDYIVAVLPGLVFELNNGDHRPVCAFCCERGTA